MPAAAAIKPDVAKKPESTPPGPPVVAPWTEAEDDILRDMKATNKPWKIIGAHLPGRDDWTVKQRWKQLNAAKTGTVEEEKKDEAKAEEKKDEKEVGKVEKDDEKREDKRDDEVEKKDEKDEKKDEETEEKQEEKKEEKKEDPPLKSALKTTKTETKADTAPKKLGDKPIIYMDKDDQCTTEDVSALSPSNSHLRGADMNHHRSILCSTSFMAERRKTSGLRLPLASSTRLASVLIHSI